VPPDAKNTPGALLDRMQRGEEIMVTRYGKPVARLLPATGTSDRFRLGPLPIAFGREYKFVKAPGFDWGNL